MPKFEIKRKEKIPAEVAVEVYEQKIEKAKEYENEDAVQRAHENRAIEEPVIETKENIENITLYRNVFSMNHSNKKLRITIPDEMELNDKDLIKFEKVANNMIIMHRIPVIDNLKNYQDKIKI